MRRLKQELMTIETLHARAEAWLTSNELTADMVLSMRVPVGFVNNLVERLDKAEALLADVGLQRDEFFARCERVEQDAEAAIVSLQAQSAELLIQRDYFATTLQIVQEQRDQNCDALSDLQAQLQAIAQEMRDAVEAGRDYHGAKSVSRWIKAIDAVEKL